MDMSLGKVVRVKKFTSFELEKLIGIEAKTAIKVYKNNNFIRYL
jgi:hypothetical protein